MTTPFIKTLQVSGGSFYTCSSAAEDLAMTFNSSVNKFKFSKFALINIPNIAVPAFSDNKIQWNAIDGHMIHGLSADQDVNLAESFQNYFLNLESTVVSQSTYDRSIKQNASERIFFKWLKELGAIRYTTSNSMQSTLNQTTNPRFVEESEVLTGAERYNRVVQYLGDIQIVNSVQNNTNAYSELYIHIPTSDGNTPLVMFKTLSDSNYSEDMTMINEPTDPLNNEILQGRNYYDTHPAGLSITAFFDQDTLTEPVSMFYNSVTDDYDIPQNWYDPNSGPNAYFTDPDFIDTVNDRIQKTFGLNQITYVRSRLDGVMLDFDPTSYKPVVDNPRISTLMEYNSTVDAQPFEFNAVLVYYDVYDPNDAADYATNLYGILFLENVEQISTEYGIPRFEKFKPNVVTKLNGNSYGFKLNIKFDTSIDNVGVEKSINDYNTFSMELFVDTMNVLQSAATILTDQVAEIAALKDKILELESLIINQTQAAELDLRMTDLEDTLVANQALLSNSSDIMALINKYIDELANLVEGKTSLDVSYNLDVIKQGDGMVVDRTVPNIVTLSNANQSFNIQSTVDYQGDVSTGLTLVLQPFTNYYRHFTNGLTVTATGDLYLRIDDSTNKWQRGQTFRLAIEDILDMSTYSLLIVTDTDDALGLGSYGAIVGALSGAQFDAASDTPIFDIMCVDPDTYTFIIDQIR